MDGISRRNFRTARGALNQWLATGLFLGGLSLSVDAADIYASRAADGSLLYANQPLDPSYSLLFSDAPPASAVAMSPVSRRQAAGAQRLRAIIETIARRHDVPADLVSAIVAVESGFNPLAQSAKGARGAMQLMPATAGQYGISQAQLNTPEHNIEAGVLHLKSLLARHNGNLALALAAYNAGSGAIVRHGQRIPPYSETMLYVPAVLSRAGATQP